MTLSRITGQYKCLHPAGTNSLSATVAALILVVLSILSAHASCSDPPFIHADWSYCDKQKENLSNANLMVANLSYANLTNADLKDTNLKKANMTGTKGVPSPAEVTTTESEEDPP